MSKRICLCLEFLNPNDDSVLKPDTFQSLTRFKVSADDVFVVGVVDVTDFADAGRKRITKLNDIIDDNQNKDHFIVVVDKFDDRSQNTIETVKLGNEN